MILTGRAIREEVRRGAITIDPFDDDLVNPNSYNYRLGSTVGWFDGLVDARDSVVPAYVEIPAEGLVFQPGRVYLGHTLEVIGSDVFVPSLIGRSSVGRLGVFLQVSADLGHIGAVHRWTLEIVATQPTRLYAGMRVGQVSFWAMVGERQPYTGVFGRYSFPAPCEPGALFDEAGS